MTTQTWRRIAFGSPLVFVVSMFLPSVAYGTDRMVGWEAVTTSIVAGGFLFSDEGGMRLVGLACVLGFAANVFYLVGYLALLVAVIERPKSAFTLAARSFAVFSLVLAIGSVSVLLATAGPTRVSFGIGAILWILSMLMLSTGCRITLTSPGGFPVVLAET